MSNRAPVPASCGGKPPIRHMQVPGSGYLNAEAARPARVCNLFFAAKAGPGMVAAAHAEGGCRTILLHRRRSHIQRPKG